MKILIVDDEELTRNGLISSINWKSLGIHTILQADDGLKGIEIASKYKPEIILCDVRMPRMDGISMLKQLEKVLPDSISIFMSGYSDKEYLKAAIKLHAIQYIEKPLNLAEVTEAVTEAREMYLSRQRAHRGETLHSIETSSKIAMQLTVPYNGNAMLIEQLAQELSISWNPSTYFTSIIVQLASPADFTLNDEFYHELKAFLKQYEMDYIYMEKKSQYLVYHIFGEEKPSEAFGKQLRNHLHHLLIHCDKYHIAIGDTYSGVGKAYQSYESAVIYLQNSFFYPSGTVLSSDIIKKSDISISGHLPYSPEQEYYNALIGQSSSLASEILKELYQVYSNNRIFLPNQIKDLYFKLFSTLDRARKQLQISKQIPDAGILDSLERCFTFQELHALLTQKTDSFFNDAQSSQQENSTIYLIKDYIGRNFSNPTLSVKDISTHVFLSTSYVCTFFKNETGQTLNQYLTEYRMEKAKLLLSDSRYKITDISSKVGYTDGNYFGKSFKKYTGLSPSEYRDKNI